MVPEPASTAPPLTQNMSRVLDESSGGAPELLLSPEKEGVLDICEQRGSVTDFQEHDFEEGEISWGSGVLIDVSWVAKEN